MKAIINLCDQTLGHRSVSVRTMRRRYDPAAGSAISVTMFALAAFFGLWLTMQSTGTRILGPVSMDTQADAMTTGSLGKPNQN